MESNFKSNCSSDYQRFKVTDEIFNRILTFSNGWSATNINRVMFLGLAYAFPFSSFYVNDRLVELFSFVTYRENQSSHESLFVASKILHMFIALFCASKANTIVSLYLKWVVRKTPVTNAAYAQMSCHCFIVNVIMTVDASILADFVLKERSDIYVIHVK